LNNYLSLGSVKQRTINYLLLAAEK